MRNKRFFVDRTIAADRGERLKADVLRHVGDGGIAVLDVESALDSNLPSELFFHEKILIESQYEKEQLASDDNFDIFDVITNKYFYWFHCGKETQKGKFAQVVTTLPTYSQVMERAQTIKHLAIGLDVWGKGRLIRKISNFDSWSLLELDLPCYTTSRDEMFKAAKDKRRLDLFDTLNNKYLFELCKNHKCPYFLDVNGELTDMSKLLF